MIIEIRTYRLKPGTRDSFVKLMREVAVPMLADAGIDTVRCGPSLVDEDGHEEAYLMRAFASLDALEAQETAFYGSDAWRSGPRDAILACIESYHSIAIEATAAALDALRIPGNGPDNGPDKGPDNGPGGERLL
jgi:hypothetical protein